MVHLHNAAEFRLEWSPTLHTLLLLSHVRQLDPDIPREAARDSAPRIRPPVALCGSVQTLWATARAVEDESRGMVAHLLVGSQLYGTLILTMEMKGLKAKEKGRRDTVAEEERAMVRVVGILKEEKDGEVMVARTGSAAIAAGDGFGVVASVVLWWGTVTADRPRTRGPTPILSTSTPHTTAF